MPRYKNIFAIIKCLLLILPVFVLTAFSVCEAGNRLSDIRYWSSPTFTRIVLDLKGDALYDSFSLKKPDRIVLDLKEFDGYIPKNMIKVDDGIIKGLRVSKKGRSIVRIVVDLENKSEHKIFPLKKIDGKPPRLVIDITRPDLENVEKEEREATRKQKQNWGSIVVVDPGHGGEDPGAVGKNGTKEKDIVFRIAKKVVLSLNTKQGIKAYLTRNGDYFIPLKKRMEIARQYGADLFISIHADSSFSRKVYGSSVYCLSLKGASSASARLTAKMENASDFIGGVPLDHQNSDLNAIIIDLVQTHNLNSSLKFAGLTINEISKINMLHTEKPQQAKFAVLKAPDVPSILIEIDFISNPAREKKMKTRLFQDAFACNIVNAAQKFLSATKGEPLKPKSIYHYVKKGETLSSIAKQYKTSVNTLRKLNGMSTKSVLRYGDKIRVL